MKGRSVIAERRLFYAEKGRKDRREFVVQVVAPELVGKDAKSFPVDDGAAICTVQFHGLDERSFDVHGIDQIHALAQAADVDRYLRAMAAKYDFYWASGEPYFDD